MKKLSESVQFIRSSYLWPGDGPGAGSGGEGKLSGKIAGGEY